MRIKDEIDKIIEDYQKTLSVNETCKNFGISRTYFYMIVPKEQLAKIKLLREAKKIMKKALNIDRSICIICHKQFTHNKNTKHKTCSRRCSELWIFTKRYISDERYYQNWRSSAQYKLKKAIEVQDGHKIVYYMELLEKLKSETPPSIPPHKCRPGSKMDKALKEIEILRNINKLKGEDK